MSVALPFFYVCSVGTPWPWADSMHWGAGEPIQAPEVLVKYIITVVASLLDLPYAINLCGPIRIAEVFIMMLRVDC